MKKIIILLLISLFSIFAILFYFLSQKIHQDPIKLLNTVFSSVKSPTLNNQFNLMILGLDYRDDTLEKNSNTDTIIFASYLPDKNKIKLASLPRDLWDDQIKEKINKIYPNSLETTKPFSFIKSNFSRILGKNIDRVIVIRSENLIELTNIVGGVDVYLDNGFVDNEYPNPEYIKNPSPSVPMYKTVSFSSGLNHLDANNVTEFVRSRKSTSDIERSKRQQLLIDALLSKIKSKEFIANISNLINLYNFWQQKIQTDFSDSDIVSLVSQEKTKLLKVALEKVEITTSEEKGSSIFYHPKSFANNQWVFLPSVSDYSQLHQFIDENIFNK